MSLADEIADKSWYFTPSGNRDKFFNADPTGARILNLQEIHGQLSNNAAKANKPAAQYDTNKLPLAFVPPAAIRGIARVMEYGGKDKYAKEAAGYEQYRKGLQLRRGLSAVLRHVNEVLSGNDIDPESGCHHLEHATSRLAFLLQNIADGTLIDDRYKPEVESK